MCGQWPVALQMRSVLPGSARCTIVAHRDRRDHVVRALHDERRHLDRGEIAAVVREERRLGESSRDHRIGGAEARLELLR